MKRRSGEIDSLAPFRNMKKQPTNDGAENLKNLLRKISERTPKIGVERKDSFEIEATTVQIGSDRSFQVSFVWSKIVAAIFVIQVTAQDLLDIVYDTSIMGLTGTAVLERERRKLNLIVTQKITDVICIS